MTSISNSNAIVGGLNQTGGFVTPIPILRKAPAAEFELPKVEMPPAPIAGKALLEQAVGEANKLFTQIRSDVQFVVDEDSKKIVVRLVESTTGEVINQYPTDQAIEIGKALAQMQERTAELHATFKSSDLQGLLFKQKT